MKACGDWIFYLQLARGGLISYSPESTNHYRQHSSNSSVNLQAEQGYLAEHINVAEWILAHYRLSDAACQKLQQELRQRWRERQQRPLPAPLEERIAALHPIAVGSRISGTEDLELPFGWFGRLGWPVVRPMVRWGLQRSLRRFAELLG